MTKEKTESATIKITLVPHGYEINRGQYFACRAYGDDINIEKAIKKIVNTVRNLDKTCPEGRKKGGTR